MSAGKTVTDLNSFRYDPFMPEVMANPLPFYRVLREHYPVYFIPEYETYFLSRFQDAWEMLSATDNTFIASEGPLPNPDVLRAPHLGVAVEAPTNPLAAPAHYGSPTLELIRHAQNAPLRPGAVKRLADLIRDLARQRLDILLPRGRFDLTQHYAGIVAAAVQCHLFRLPLSEAKHVLDTVNAASITDPLTGGKDYEEQRQRLRELVEPTVRARRREGADGSFPLVDGMLELTIDGRRLTDTEIARTIGIVLIGGTETVPKVVAHGLWELQKNPEQLEEVRADLASNAATAFREMVRYCGPAQWFMRTVHKPVTLAGQDMKVGQRVIYLVPSAARDEREYGADAESFRWNRRIDRWVNFGWGPHFCLGYHLAMLEGRILVEEFLRRVPEFRIDERRAVRLPSNFQWGWNRLPVEVPIEA
jgi:cytochrome P450